MITEKQAISYSVDPNTGEKYKIPTVVNDRTGIETFLNANQGKKVVVIQGLGFVGAVMSLVCANALTEEYAVIGVDLLRTDTLWKIKSINTGSFPIKTSDPKIDLFYQNAIKKANLYATFDPIAYAMADVIIIDINLDVAKQNGSAGELIGYDVDLTAFKKAIATIGNHCKDDVLILVETTVPPGTSQKIVRPIIQQCLDSRGLSDSKFRLGHSYERVMPGPGYVDSIQNFYRVYSGINEESADATETFLKTIISVNEYPLTRLGSTNATEMAKVLENSFRAMNIAFVEEWARFAEEAEVNLFEVVSAIRLRPTHRNLMLPGIGVGGYCLTKDPLLASWSKQNLFNSHEGLAQSEKGVRINDRMPVNVYRQMKEALGLVDLKEKKVLLLGVSYRSNVGDTRYTPVQPFFDKLIQDGAHVSLHDPYVSYWEEKSLPVSDSYDTITQGTLDIVIFTTGHQEYLKDDQVLNLLLNTNRLHIFDAVGILPERFIKSLIKADHIVRVIGRGDIK